MKKLFILLICILLLIQVAYADRIYKIKLVNLGNRLSKSSITVAEGSADERQDNVYGYSAKIFDQQDKISYLTGFTPPSYGEFILKLPYRYDGKEIIVETPSKNNLNIPISHFAQTCDDGICQDYESYEDCPEDCKSGSEDDYCDGVDDSICDPDCDYLTDKDCKQPRDAVTEPIQTEPDTEPEQKDPIVINKPSSFPDPPPPGSRQVSKPMLSPDDSSNTLLYSILGFFLIIIVLLIIIVRKKQHSGYNPYQ